MDAGGTLPADETDPRGRERLGLLLGFLGVVMFGGTLPFTRLAVAELDPWFVTFGRAAVAGLIAVAVIAIVRPRLPPRTEFIRYALAAVMLVIGFPGLTGLAMVTVPAIHGAVVLGVMPLTTAAMSALIFGERPSPLFWACATAGSALVVVFAIRDGGFGLAMGDLYLLGAVLATAIGYVLSADLSRRTPGWLVISWMLVLMLPVTIPAALWTMPPDPAAISRAAWTGFAYVAVISMYLGFFAWNTGLAIGGTARVSQVQLLQTFVSLAIAVPLLGETLDWRTLLFALAVVAVVAIGRRARITQRG